MTIEKSKTDQEAQGQVIAIVRQPASPYCPVQALLNWEQYAGHSLRSGFLTSAAKKRANIFKMADQSRHKSLEMMREYVRETEIFDDNAGAGLLID